MSGTAWYAARSSGILAHLLPSSSVVLGILMAGHTRFTRARFPVEEVHRFLATLPQRVWRRIHYLTLAVWLLATAHGLLAGTDRVDPWFAALAAASIAATGTAAYARFAPHRLPA